MILYLFFSFMVSCQEFIGLEMGKTSSNEISSGDVGYSFSSGDVGYSYGLVSSSSESDSLKTPSVVADIFALIDVEQEGIKFVGYECKKELLDLLLTKKDLPNSVEIITNLAPRDSSYDKIIVDGRYPILGSFLILDGQKKVILEPLFSAQYKNFLDSYFVENPRDFDAFRNHFWKIKNKSFNNDYHLCPNFVLSAPNDKNCTDKLAEIVDLESESLKLSCENLSNKQLLLALVAAAKKGINIKFLTNYYEGVINDKNFQELTKYPNVLMVLTKDNKKLATYVIGSKNNYNVGRIALLGAQGFIREQESWGYLSIINNHDECIRLENEFDKNFKRSNQVCLL